MTHRRQHPLERREKQQHVRHCRSRTHQPDSPDAPGKRSKARADLDVELVEQTPANRGLVDALGNPNRVQRPESFGDRRQQRQSKRLETRGQREVIAPMTRPPNLEPLFLDNGQRFPDGIDERGGDRMVIFPADPVVFEQSEVEIETARRGSLRQGAR